MKSSNFLIVFFVISIGFFSCSKEKNNTVPNSKICQDGFLFYKNGKDFLILASAFTPANGDGINDVFAATTNMSLDSIMVRIYRADGTLLYESNNFNIWWLPNRTDFFDDYQLYVETTIKNNGAADIVKCSPLFVLKTEPGKPCVINAKIEDKDKYVFTDQLDARGEIYPVSYDCVSF